jgi:hypothetical protein
MRLADRAEYVTLAHCRADRKRRQLRHSWLRGVGALRHSTHILRRSRKRRRLLQPPHDRTRHAGHALIACTVAHIRPSLVRTTLSFAHAAFPYRVDFQTAQNSCSGRGSTAPWQALACLPASSYLELRLWVSPSRCTYGCGSPRSLWPVAPLALAAPATTSSRRTAAMMTCAVASEYLKLSVLVVWPV